MKNSSGQLNIYSIPGFRLAAWFSVFLLYLPIIILVWFSFNENRLITIWTRFSLDWYIHAFANYSIQRALYNSLIVAFTAMLVSTLLATMAALVTVHCKYFRGRTAVEFLFGLPLVVPEMITAISSLAFFTLIGLRLGLLNVILTHIVFCFPFAYYPICARLAGIDRSFSEVAQDLYATDWKEFWYVTFPLLKSGITAGAMLAFIVSLDDFIITSFVASPGSTTLPVYIYGMIAKGITPEINAISSVLLLLSILFVGASTFLTQGSKV